MGDGRGLGGVGDGRGFRMGGGGGLGGIGDGDGGGFRMGDGGGLGGGGVGDGGSGAGSDTISAAPGIYIGKDVQRLQARHGSRYNQSDHK